MTFDFNTKYSEYQGCYLHRAFYHNNGHVYVGVENDEGPIANITVNVDGIREYPADCSAVDTNNFPEADELIERLGIGVFMGFAMSGFCTYPVYKFNFNAVDRYV